MNPKPGSKASVQGGGSNVRVAMRVRPRNQKEIEVGAQEIITVQGNGCTIMDPTAFVAAEAIGSDGKGIDLNSFTRTFHFDHCYCSSSPRNDDQYASQEKIYDDLGISILENAWEGYNCSIFAYGQTGAGKSYTMMGTGTALDDKVGTEDYGLIPRVCCGLFGAIEQVYNEQQGDSNMHYSVEVSYMEIYKEMVKDLFNPKSKSLKVREHPKTGAYVEDLCMVAVGSYQEIGQLIAYGGKTRTVASTNMNQFSSRSHAIFTLVFRQTKLNLETNSAVEKISRINLVDLAGSERVNLTGSTGERLKEANSINRSLANLSDVIKSLASAHKKSRPRKDHFIPYRNSVLTWLLKESLGGNAKTIMVAAISPCDVHFEETLSTLRYAERAKHVRNHAIVNQDSSERLIDQLKAEINHLREQLAARNVNESAEQMGNLQLEMQLSILQEQLQEKEQLIQELTSNNSSPIRRKSAAVFQQMSLALPENEVDGSAPRLINLNQDPLFSECLVYYLKEGTSVVGSAEDVTIQLSGEDMAPQHCVISHTHGLLMLCPLSPEALCFVNGERVGWNNEENRANPICLTHKARVVFGRHHFFRCEQPESPQTKRLSTETLSMEETVIDWEFAQKELVEKSGLPSVFGPNSFSQLQTLEEKVRKLEAERQAYKRELENRIGELSERSSVKSSTETSGRWRPFLVGGSDSETASFAGVHNTIPMFVGHATEMPSGAESDTSSSTAYREVESHRIRTEQRKARLRHRQMKGLQMKQRRASGSSTRSGGGGASLGLYSNMDKKWNVPTELEEDKLTPQGADSAFEGDCLRASEQRISQQKPWPQQQNESQGLSPPTSPPHYVTTAHGSPSISDLSINSGPSVRAPYNSNYSSTRSRCDSTAGGEIDVLYDQLNNAQSRIDTLERDLQSIVRLASGNDLQKMAKKEDSDRGIRPQSSHLDSDGQKEFSRRRSGSHSNLVEKETAQFKSAQTQHGRSNEQDTLLRQGLNSHSNMSDREAARARSVQRQRERRSRMLKAETEKQKALMQQQYNKM